MNPHFSNPFNFGAIPRELSDYKKSKVVILLTDGRNNTGELTPQKAADIAKTMGVKVYTIGAGGRGKAPFLEDSLFGKQVAYQDVDIDDATLKEVAEKTGGVYFRAEDATGLEKIYAQIDTLEKTEIISKTYLEYNEHFAWFAAVALALMLLEHLLLGTWLRKIP